VEFVLEEAFVTYVVPDVGSSCYQQTSWAVLALVISFPTIVIEQRDKETNNKQRTHPWWTFFYDENNATFSNNRHKERAWISSVALLVRLRFSRKISPTLHCNSLTQELEWNNVFHHW